MNTKHFTKNQLLAISGTATISIIATLAILFAAPHQTTPAPAQPQPGTASVSNSPAIVVNDQGQISDTTGGSVNPLEPYFVGFDALNDNPWGLTGTQVDIITQSLADAIITQNQAKPADLWTTKVSLDTNSISQTNAPNGDTIMNFVVVFNDQQRHNVTFTIPLDYNYRLTLDATDVPIIQ